MGGSGWTPIAGLALLAWFHAGLVEAGPPFQTDDPEPVPLHHYEAYAFGALDHGGGSTFLLAPAFEFNVGAAPDLQLHVVVPMAYLTPDDAFGMGDVELGVKYRFVHETAGRPQVGTFPMLELPTGDGERGLGNGRLWARLPVWLQKSFGPWTTFGGVGYEVNHASGMKDSVFGGWLLQRTVTRRLVVGGEVFSQQAQAVGARGTTFVDGGGYLQAKGNLSLLFMLGHTLAGESHTVGYLGLYYTWGHDRTSPTATDPMPSAVSGPRAGRPRPPA